MRKTLVLVLALIFTLSCYTGMAWNESNSDLYQKAIDLLKENRYAEAGEAFAALGSYSDAPRYTMYCNAIVAGEAGLYAVAVDNLKSLNGFLDSSLLATYYAGLSWEAGENYERAREVMSGITLYRDVANRMLGYPALINARDYRKADANEQAGQLEDALEGFKVLGSYEDSAERAAAVQEKIYARDYAAADKAEQEDRLEDALEGFKALGSYSDSAERAAAVQTKIDEREAAAEEQARADAYAAADKAEHDGDYASAYSGFTALGDYMDSADRAAAVQDKGNYALALQYAMDGKFSDAYTIFSELGDYEDSPEKAYALGVTEFSDVSNRYNGIAAFKFHDLWGLINVNTNVTVSPYWDEIGQFNAFGLARVSKGSKYGYIDTNGDVVVPCDWYQVSEFSEDGMCTVAQETVTGSGWSAISSYTFGLFDAEGKAVTPAVWQSLGGSINNSPGTSYNSPSVYAPIFSDGKTKVQNTDGLYGFIDLNGNTVGEIRWSSILDYSENLAIVVEDEKYGFVDEEGNVIIQPQYNDARSFSEGLAGVKAGELWQFIDRDNNVVIPARYGSVYSFKDGKAHVLLPGTGWQIIDAKGSLVYFVSSNTAEAYAQAKELLEAGSYEKAYEAFTALAGYKDSDELAAEAGYQAAKALMEAGEYARALAIFDALDGYKDAAELAEQTRAAAAEAGIETETDSISNDAIIAAVADYMGISPDAEDVRWFLMDMFYEYADYSNMNEESVIETEMLFETGEDLNAILDSLENKEDFVAFLAEVVGMEIG